MLKPLLLLLLPFCLLASPHLICQSASGVITDENGSPIAYATIYASDAEAGTLTDEDGAFTIDLKQVPDSSHLQFSCIGYEGRRLTAGELRGETGPFTLQLSAINYVLETAEVAAKRIRIKRKQIGMPGIMNATYIYANVTGLRVEEIGTLLTPDEPGRLEEVIIKIRAMDADSILMDINIYDVQFGLVGPQLLKERLFLRLSSEDVRKDIHIDLSKRGIKVDRSFLVTYRVLKATGGFGELRVAGKTGFGRGSGVRKAGFWKDSYMIPNIRAKVGYVRE